MNYDHCKYAFSNDYTKLNISQYNQRYDRCLNYRNVSSNDALSYDSCIYSGNNPSKCDQELVSTVNQRIVNNQTPTNVVPVVSGVPAVPSSRLEDDLKVKYYDLSIKCGLPVFKEIFNQINLNAIYQSTDQNLRKYVQDDIIALQDYIKLEYTLKLSINACIEFYEEAVNQLIGCAYNCSGKFKIEKPSQWATVIATLYRKVKDIEVNVNNQVYTVIGNVNDNNNYCNAFSSKNCPKMCNLTGNVFKKCKYKLPTIVNTLRTETIRGNQQLNQSFGDNLCNVYIRNIYSAVLNEIGILKFTGVLTKIDFMTKNIELVQESRRLYDKANEAIDIYYRKSDEVIANSLSYNDPYTWAVYIQIIYDEADTFEITMDNNINKAYCNISSTCDFPCENTGTSCVYNPNRYKF